jgi:trimeric autotransporter adhesin
VATILILALTVVLFASLFAFVSHFPAPPAQSVNQFQATVTHTATAVTGVSILLEGGPPVPSADRVYLESTRSTSNWQFSYSPGIPVAWGTNNASAGWVSGAYWATSFKTSIAMPVNITVYIVSSSQLLYEGVVPGIQPSVPPILTNAYTVPSTIAVGAAFQIYADVSGNVSGLTVNVSLGEVPGLTSTIETMTYSGSSGVYSLSVTSALGTTTKNGTYLAFIQGVNATGSTIAGSVEVTLISSSSSGSSNPSASVAISPNPATVRTNATLVASISNPTSSSLTVTNVTYYVNYTSNGTSLANTPIYSSSTLPTIAAGTSGAVTSKAWMVPPSAVGEAVNLVARVTFSSGHTTGTSQATFQAAPFSGELTLFPQNLTTTTNGTWFLLVTAANTGNLGDSTVNATIYVNNTTSGHTTTAVGEVLSPPGWKPTNPGYATSSTQTIGASTTASYIAKWTLGGKATRPASTLSVVVILKITNSAWSGFTSTAVVIKESTTFTT